MERLDTYFKEYNGINEDENYLTYKMNPKELINPRRIDLIVKYYYIKSRETGEDVEFAKELYGKHIEAFTDGTFEEHGNKEKNSLDKYLEIFDELIDSFKEEGFNAERSVLPIGGNNELLDGSHRTACALYFETEVTVMKFPELSVDYGFDFFRRRLLDEMYLDFIAKEYVRLNEAVSTLVVWPIVGTKKNKQFIEAEIKRQGAQIIYHKSYHMTREALEDFVFTIYRQEHWVGFNLENFHGVKEKASFGYDEKGQLILYVLEGISFEQLDRIKEKLRADFQVGKSSIHTGDTHEESVEMVNFMFAQDYKQRLHQNFMDRKDIDHTFTRYVHRKLRYFYRVTINQLKRLFKKPV